MIKGINLGNWLVLEKWMKPELFDGTDAEDETWLARKLPAEELKKRMKEHRDTFITEPDFAYIKEQGFNLVRIPVPYFIFGNRRPFIGCIKYLDKAFVWAKKYRLKIMIDLHTTPGNQNGYDNGGIIGVCKWHRDPEEVKFVLHLLGRLAKRYAFEEALFGIEVLNEPISLPIFLGAPSTRQAVDKEEAKGSGFVPLHFLRPFYKKAYEVIRRYLSEDKAIIFHDGYRMESWLGFFKKNKMKNVYLDAHIYIFHTEGSIKKNKLRSYNAYIFMQKQRLKFMSSHLNVIVGEWCISNSYANDFNGEKGMTPEQIDTERKRRYNEVAALQLNAWSVTKGDIYWSYKFGNSVDEPLDGFWKESWDVRRCIKNGWLKAPGEQ